MRFVKNKLASIRERVTKGFRYAIRKQLQLALRFISSFVLMAIILFFFHPKPVQYSITPSFKIIDGEYKTTLWKYNYYQTICSQERTQIGAFWTQQCILSSHTLPEMKSNYITVTLQQLQPQSIRTVRLCRHIQSINKSICQERFVEHEEVEIVEIDLQDVVFLSVALRLKDGRSSYFTNPTVVVHTNPGIIVLLIHRFYLIFAGIMAGLFALIVSLCLIVKDIYYYTERSEENDERRNKEIINKKK